MRVVEKATSTAAGWLRLKRVSIRLARLALTILAAAMALAPRAAAQGCAMCYQSAAGSGSHGIAALQRGILILLIPSACLFVGIFGLIYSRRNVSR